MKLKLKKKKLWAILAIAIIIVGLIIYNATKPKPYYPNIDSPRPILGNQNATIRIVEFSDLQCPACKLASGYPQRLVNDFGDNVSIEFKPFPLTTIHQYSYKAAQAAECANDQGKFWEFVDLAFQNQPALSVPELKSYAKEMGLDTASFNACLDSDAKSAIVDSYLREGYSLDIPGTPTFFVDGKQVTITTGYADLEAAVNAELSKK